MKIRLFQYIIDVLRGKRPRPIRGTLESRRHLLSKFVDYTTASGLEYGPLGSQIVPSTYNIKFADLQDRNGILEYYKNDTTFNHNNIPEIHYVVKKDDPTYSIHEKFDYVISNHVIEHTPNAFKYLEGILSLLKPNGILFLSIPDMRYTFDKGRSLTPSEHFIADYFMPNNHKNDFEHILDSYRYSRDLKVKTPIKNNIKELVNRTLSKIDSDQTKKHFHVHTFTKDSFRNVINDFIDLEISPCELLHLGSHVNLILVTISNNCN